jgi:hypothetical protein
MYFSRWWFMFKVAGALAQLHFAPKRFDRALYESVLDVGMLEGLSPEETALLLFHQIPAAQWSDQALLKVAHWKRHSRLRDSAERKALQFRSGVPFDEVFPTAARYARRLPRSSAAYSAGQGS